MKKMIGAGYVSQEAIQVMRSVPINFPSTRWAAYQNQTLDSIHCGKFLFLATGPKNHFPVVPETMPKEQSLLPYEPLEFFVHVGYLNLDSGKIVDEISVQDLAKNLTRGL